MQYKLLHQNINDLFYRQTIAAWKNLKAQNDSFCLNDELIGFLNYQLPKHCTYGEFYSKNLMNYFSFVLELRKAFQDIIKSTPTQEIALAVTLGPFLFQKFRQFLIN